MIDAAKQFPEMVKRCEEAIVKAFPIASTNHVLSASNFRWEDLGDDVTNNIALHKEYKTKDKTLTAKLIADLEIREKGGRSVDKMKHFVLLTLPHVTCRSSYIVNGHEVQTVNQLRLRPGPYTRYTASNDTETFINAAGGGYKIVFERETGRLRLKSGTSHIDIYPILAGLGITDKAMLDAWGSEVFEANKKYDDPGALEKLYHTMRKFAEPVTDRTQLKTAVDMFFRSKTIDPRISKITLGKEYKAIEPGLLFDAASKAVALANGFAKPDDTESLAFKSIHSVEDFVPEKIAKAVPFVTREISYKMDRDPKITSLISPATFSGTVLSWFETSEFTRYSEQNNPVDMAGTVNLTTTMGEGGIQSTHAVKDEVRLVHPSHMGFLDPVHSPEGCFGPESEVMTDRGWVPWPSVSSETRFACLLDDGHLEYHPPEELQKYHYSGPMFGFRSETIEYLVTPNHRMWCRTDDPRSGQNGNRKLRLPKTMYRFETAEEIHGKRRKVMCGGHLPYEGRQKDRIGFVLPKIMKENATKTFPAFRIEDFAALLGWYLSEGNLNGLYRSMITQTLSSSPENCEEIADILTRMHLRWCFDGKKRFTISGKQLRDYLSQFGKSRTKFIPEEAFEWPERARRALLDTLMKGDGRKPRNGWNNAAYCTNSLRLAKDVERLCFGLGISTRVTLGQKAKSPKHADTWEVRLHSRTERDVAPRLRAFKSKQYIKKYDGLVYCATVPGGRLYCRLNGKGGCWYGNSKIGITGHLALGAEKRGNDLIIRVTDAKTGETVHKTPQELELAVIAFNDQYDLTKARPKPVSPMVKAKNGSKIEIVPAASVQYIFRDPKGFFSIVTNAIPFLHNNSPNRVLMADRHIEQSVPLKDPDMPLVQSRYVGELGYHDFFGRSFNARSPEDGVVAKITKDEIRIKVGKEVKTVYLHNNYPLNGDAFLHDTPIVKVGDKVKKGQVLADNNFSKNGTLTFSKRLTSVSGDTHVLWFDEMGGHFTPIQDTPARAGVRSLAMCSDGKIVTSPIKAFIGHYTDRGMYKIITDTGTIVKATESHSFVTAGEDGHLIKVKPEEMKEGITLLPQAHSFELPEDIGWAEGHAKRGAASIRLRLDRDAGFLFGIYVAEGSGRRAIMMAATEPEIREKLVAIAKKWGLGYKETPTMIVIYSAALRNLLHEKCGYLSQHKRIPDLLWSAPREFKIGFIDGYWSGDGSANKGNVSAATASYTLAVGLRMLLAHLGVRTHLGMEPAKGTHMASWNIRAYQETLGNFPELSLLRKHKGVVRLASLPMSLSRDRIPITHQQRLLIDKILGKQIRNDVGYVTRPMIEGIIEKLPEEIQRLYKAPVWWDVAVSVVPTDFEDYVYDLDMTPVSTFLVESGLAVHNTAYMPYKGMNFEDGIVISEGAAKKLTSSHKYDLRLDKTATMKTGLKIWLAHYPDKADIVKPDKYDPDGIVKKGAILAKGDPVIPAVEQAQIDEEMAYARLHKSLRTPFRDVSIYWEENYPGEVIDVVKTGKFIRVFVKTDEALQIGDKLSQSAGGKGIVVALIPDNEMYRDEKGNVIDVLFNPASVGGRVNPGQLFEATAGKIAEKTGKKYLVDNFSYESSLKKLQNDLKANGLKDTENVFDPVGNRTIENVFVGQVPFFKLKHQVRHKFSAKGIGPYTGEQQPAKVSGESAQNIGTGELYALLGGGSTHFLKDVSTLKSQSNPEYWRAYQLGLPTPPPKSPYILDKFMTYLEGAGINLVQDGSQFKVLPLTDKAVLAKSNGEIKNPSVVRASDLRPEAGGLFDREITGGFGGVHWNHIALESPMPNPLMERPIVSVTKITSSQFKQIMEGLLFVKPDGSMTTDHTQGKAAGEGIKHLLDRIDVDKELKEIIPVIRTARSTQLDDLNRRRRYLQALKLSGLNPSQAYIQSVVPVIPPIFRQIYPLPDGALNVADPNHCYREILLVNNQLKDLKAKGVDSKNLANLRSSLYGAVQGMAGVTEPLTRGKNFQGFISTIKGRINKYGLFQGRVVKRPQDLSGRSTIIPNPKFGIDDVGIPEDMGLVIYKPFIMRRLVVSGIPPMQASELIEKKDERAMAALRAEVKERPVYFNRAPTLHKFGIMAFKPTIVKGQAIQINPLVVKGFNADIDGDTMGIHVPVSEDARKEAFNKMPSTHLLAVTDFSVMHAPSKEYALGLYLMTEPKGIPIQAKATSEAISMYEAGKIKINTPVVVGGKIWTAGQAIVNDLFPSDLKPGNVTITRKIMDDFLSNLARKHPKEAGAVINSLKDWGAKAVTEIGFSVGLKDLETDYKARDLILSDAAKAAKTVGFDKAYLDATSKMNDLVKNSKENRFVIGNITSGAFGKGSQITQMIATPVAMVDHKGEVIKVPITKSYAEGHDIASYWATIPGSRKGLMDKGLGTQDVGTLSKRLVNTTIEQIISTMDCGTEQGIPMPPDSRDALDRVIARGPYKGQVVTPEFAGKLKSKGVPEIVVRSPLRCSAIRGICAKCYGLAENGQLLPVGFHVGALVGQSVSEPVLQTMLRGFHTGGAISKSRVGFDRIEEIFEMPENVVGKATISMQGGAVTSVKPGLGGGWNVTVGTMNHFVPKELGLAVKHGDKVTAGQKLSETGAIKPQELLEATGDIHRVRDQIITDLNKEYSGGGINMRRKLFEAAIKPMTDRAEVIDAGGAERLGIYRGDIVSINKIEDVNAKLPQKEKIQYRATLLPIRVSPFKGEDFIGKLMFERPHETLKEAPAIGAIADLAKGHPVTRFVFGSFKKA